MTLYHVYCDAQGAEVVTPSYEDAMRTFRRFVREYPDDVVDLDSCEEYDQELGVRLQADHALRSVVKVETGPTAGPRVRPVLTRPLTER